MTVSDFVIEIENALDEIMLRAMESENITTGDIHPLQAFVITEHAQAIAEVLVEVLEQNREDFENED